MTRYFALAALLIVLMPAFASADRRHDYRHYDRGDRYRLSDHNRSRFNISIGFGNVGYRDYSYGQVRYSRGYDFRSRRYYSPVVVSRPVYIAPRPVVYCPPPVVYYEPHYRPSSYYYTDTHYYYGR